MALMTFRDKLGLFFFQSRGRIKKLYGGFLTKLNKLQRRIIQPTKSYARWLKYIFQLSIPIIFICILILCLPQEITVRYGGWFLQLLGISSVVWDIDTKWKAFNLPGVKVQIRDWWHRRPFNKSEVIVNADADYIKLSAGTPRVTNRRQPPDGAPLEIRVDAIERNFGQLDQEVQALERGFDKAIAKQNAELKTERSVRKDADVSILSQLKQVQTGDLHLSLTGLGWLVVGVTLSSCSPELAVAAQWLRS